jgi:hypothetical protein
MSQVTTQLTTYLASVGLSNIAIYDWPNYDLDTWWASGAPAFALIAYTGTTLSKPVDTNTMLQERTIEYAIFLLARQTDWGQVTGVGGPYLAVQAIETALTGFRPNGCRNSYFSQERFSEQDPEGRVWLYRMDYKVITMLVKLAPVYDLALLKQLNFLVADTSVGVPNTIKYTVANSTVTLPVNSVVSTVKNVATNLVYQVGQDYLVDSLTGVVTTYPTGPNLLLDGTVVAITYAAGEIISTT